MQILCKKLGLIIFGIFLCLMPILLYPVILVARQFIPSKKTSPWNEGLILNTLHAWLRYDITSWLRRIISICKNPNLTLQYLRILLNKYEILPQIFTVEMPIELLVPQHSIETSHEHHRKRVEAYKNGNFDCESLHSYSPIIVVSIEGLYLIQDGHHRIAAMKEAGLTTVTVLMYKGKKDE
jgi:hypothetical protein